MKVFAIRHKPTGEWMPALMSRNGRGWSHWVPGSGDDVYEKGPRIFFTQQSARNALTAWLQGVHVRRAGETSGTWDNPPEYYDETTIETPPVPRVREEMEIVPMALAAEINYDALIAHCYKTLGHPQGTKGCIAFARGAEWALGQRP